MNVLTAQEKLCSFFTKTKYKKHIIKHDGYTYRKWFHSLIAFEEKQTHDTFEIKKKE